MSIDDDLLARDGLPRSLDQLDADLEARDRPASALVPQGEIGEEAAAEKGAAEIALHLGTGALAAVPAGAAYVLSGGSIEAARKVAQGLTYEPRSEVGREGLAGLGTVIGAPGRAILALADKVEPTGQLSAALSDVGERAFTAAGVLPALGWLARAKGAFPSVVGTPEVTPEVPLPENTLSAAASGPKAVSPELQQAIDEAIATHKSGAGRLNVDAGNIGARGSFYLPSGGSNIGPTNTLLGQAYHDRGDYGGLYDPRHLRPAERQLRRPARHPALLPPGPRARGLRPPGARPDRAVAATRRTGTPRGAQSLPDPSPLAPRKTPATLFFP